MAADSGQARAERVYILGHPVGHSKSPAMHNAAFSALGLHWEYGFKDCETELAARAFIDARRWRACNVTMPWKQLAFREADRRTLDAELVQGANVLVNWGGKIYSDNTDGRGCAAYLARGGVELKGSRVAVCGTGPTSLAIAHACAQAGAERVALFGRNPERTQATVSAYGDRVAEAGIEPLMEARAYDAEGLDVIASSDLVVDATPLGMKPGDPAPFDVSALSSGQSVFDVVYGHGETALVAAARERGCRVFDGSGMLVAQAVETLRFFASTTEAFSIPAHADMFAIMAEAAGFDV